jgi:hypothetical protein
MLFDNTSPVPLEHVGPTLAAFQVEVLNPLGIEAHVPVGSTGRKSISGDLDVAVRMPRGSDRKSLAARMELLPSLGRGNVRMCGQLVIASFPVLGSATRVQVDVMFTNSDTLDGISWLMAGTGDGDVHGTYRNLLLSLAVRWEAERRGVKMTLSIPGGINDPETGKRTESPRRILDIIGIDVTPEVALSFESLLRAMVSCGWTSRLLDRERGFEQYVASRLAGPRTREQALRAVGSFRSIVGILAV